MPDAHDPLKPVTLRGTPLKRKEAVDPSDSAVRRREGPPTAPPTSPLEPVSRVSLTDSRAEIPRFGTLSSTDPSQGGPHNRKFPRRPCSFPGVLRVLMPEASFIPEVMAVRVIDLSPSGARLETKQLTRDLYYQVSLEPRFVRLEIMIPSRSKITVSGKLVWTDFSGEHSTMGLSIHPRRDDLAEACLPKWNPNAQSDSQFLAPPTVDTYPTTTSRTPLRFRGRALDADRVVVEGLGTEWETGTEEDGAFSIEVPLIPDAANEFRFVAFNGSVRSDPTPVWIMHRSGHHDTQTFRLGGIFDDATVTGNGRVLKLKFNGEPGDVIQALRRVEELLGFAQSCSLSVEITGDAERAKQSLIKGGKFPFNPG